MYPDWKSPPPYEKHGPLTIHSPFQDGALNLDLLWPTLAFCEKISSDLKNNPDLQAGISTIKHYKEKGGLEHEFLLVFVLHAGREYILRVERRVFRRTPSLFKPFTLKADDTVRIGTSEQALLRAGCSQGNILLQTLFVSAGQTLRLDQFCKMISDLKKYKKHSYNLRTRQCYWYCSTLLQDAQGWCPRAKVVRTPDIVRAGTWLGIPFDPNSYPTQRVQERVKDHTFKFLAMLHKKYALTKITISAIRHQLLSAQGLIQFKQILHSTGRKPNYANLRIK
jgi:hypothetical protein